MKKLYKFNWDCGSNGEIESLFIAEENEVKEALGKEICFGEVLGKHSDIFGTLDEADLKIIDLPESTIEELEKAFGTTSICGYDPFEFIEN